MNIENEIFDKSQNIDALNFIALEIDQLQEQRQSELSGQQAKYYNKCFCRISSALRERLENK